MRGRGEDKGGEGQLLDTVGGRGEHAGDDQGLAAPSGHRHAVFGIPGAMPEAASARLFPLEAPNRKWLRHQMKNEEGNNFHVEGLGWFGICPILKVQNSVLT